MYVTIQISTGELIESQGAASEETMRANAVSAGYPANDIRFQVMTDAEYRALRTLQAARDAPLVAGTDLDTRLSRAEAQITAIQSALASAGIKIIGGAG